ncbi:MAG: DNA mismatch repair endonuclease MutL, partial [Candidatus Cloacimonetes bacterium]|nr:DNA mismatch repair endonuclease MutL [Candidatus Cloacimonadota bacterium]
AILAFERHATSKIHAVTDIFNISTLGFRGEALPSIASVSNTILVTRDKNSELATVIEFNGGKLKDISKAAANIGTTITVKKLFNNVVARKKFLKGDQIEFKHIFKYIHYQSIVHPDIQFSLISNGKQKLNYPRAASINERMSAVFGANFFENDLIEINSQSDQVKIKGYIFGLNEKYEGYEEYNYIFVNGRFIRDRIIIHAIKTAYEPFTKKLRLNLQGKTPPYILFLEVEPEKVDFNVHPAKLEIRFRDGQLIHSFVKTALSQALYDYEDKKFSEVKQKFYEASVNSAQNVPLNNYHRENFLDEKRVFQDKKDQVRFKEIKKEFEQVYQPDIFKSFTQEDRQFEQVLKQQNSSQTKIELRPEEDLINPWQLHQTYIFVQVEEGLMIIDQHAAHERVIYEKMLHRIHGAPPITQKLIFPLVIDIPPYLSSTVSELLEENIAIFSKVGFAIKTFSGNSVVVDEIPAELKDWESGQVFIEILKQLEDEFKETENFRESLAKSISCKSAIKAGQKLSKREMVALINDLFACDVPYFCPHGRPLIIKMPLIEFEKRFKRIV